VKIARFPEQDPARLLWRGSTPLLLALCEPFTVPPGPVTALNRPVADAAQPDTAS
jgi:hypothetical protein